ncbi:MAG: AAA family ATPase, partial [Ruthenibacterium sp.]
VIVDSLSHAWNNEGGVLDIKDQIASRAGKNSYTAWNEAGKEQNGLINYIFSVNCHVIATLRVKTEYALELNERGKQQPVKLGLAPVQRDD